MSRKAKGEGSVYEYRAGYRAYVTVKGKRRYFYFPNVTKKVAAQMLRERLNQRDDGTLPRGKDLTLGAWMRHWVKTAGLRPRVEYNYSRNIERYIIPTIGHIRLSELEPEDIEDLYAEMLAGNLSRAIIDRADPANPKKVKKTLSGLTIRNVHANIRAALNKAVSRRHVARNVALAVEVPEVRTGAMKTLSEADARRVLDIAMARPDAARWYLGLVYGMRPAEVLGLEARHVDRERNLIHISQQLQRVTGRGMILLPYAKTDAGDRSIPAPAPVLALIDRALDERMKQRVIHGDTYKEWEFDGEPTALLFTQPNGNPIDLAVDTRNWDQILTAAGLPHERRYIGRHTAASIMIDMGMDVAVVSAILGHKKTSFTYDTYVHPLASKKASAADELAARYGI